MPTDDKFAKFQTDFFHIFEIPQFDGKTFLDYIARDKSQRTGDEASIVDDVISGALLTALGFSDGERVYNAVKSDLSRPDFAPRVPETGDCFVVEDKATVENLDTKWRAQLAGYVRKAGLSLGLLSNGREIQLWEFAAKTERLVLTVDVAELLALRAAKKTLDDKQLRPLESLFDLLRRDAFTDAHTLAAKLAVDAATWRAQARKLGVDPSAEAELVEDLKGLVAQLHRDARRQLDAHLDAALALKRQLRWADDKGTQSVEGALEAPRALVKNAFALWKSNEDVTEFLSEYALDPRPFPSRDFFVRRVLEIHNKTLDKPLKSFADNTREPLESYAETVLSVHARRTRLEQKARVAKDVEADFVQWKDLVSETMLGDLSKSKTADEADDAQRHEFALQAAYVVFIRLLLIRVCEDKEIFPERFLSNGGLLHWQDDIRRYLKFARGNRYKPLLDMAYDNAANIYSHFFTGRELFNWYHLDETGLLEALNRLAKYDFAQVDSDLLGTVYNAYVERHEKKKQGQYYTPVPIVDFILDEVGWQDTQMIGHNKRLLDPACGSGTFLVRAAKRLMDAYRNREGEFDNPKNVLDKVREQIYGFDLNPFACYLAEVNLLIQVLDALRALPAEQRLPQLERFHVYNVDALAKPGRGTLALGHDSLLAEELDVVERIKKREAEYAGGFSHIVANPPYGAKLSDDTKAALKRDYPAVFKGQPDTYVFFYSLGLELLGAQGRLGFITPNTFLMGTNTDTLRGELLRAGRIERIVDLPQGIWKDATVDCVLLFLHKHADTDAGGVAASAGTVEINLMDLRDSLDKLTARAWPETLTQSQNAWTSDATHAMDIRRDAIQIAIEAACIVQKKMNETEFAPEVLRLGDVTDSSQGIIPYKTEADGKANLYIKPKRDVPMGDKTWKPLLDGTSKVGRYDLQVNPMQPQLKYGNHLWCERETRYFDSPKLLFIRLRNRSLERKLVATYDESGFYNRHNFNNIITEDPNYDLKYVLAVFNSRLINYWFSKRNPDVEVSIVDTRDIPIFPADAPTQTAIVKMVDELLAMHRELNGWRARGYRLKVQGQSLSVDAPFAALVAELQSATPALSTLDLQDARVLGQFTLPAECNRDATLSANLKTYGTQLTLKWKKLWLDVPDDARREFLRGFLSDSAFTGRSWNDLEDDPQIQVPETDADLTRFFEAATARQTAIVDLWTRAQTLDRQLDERILDLYGITNVDWRTKIMDSAPEADDAEATTDETMEN